MKSDEELYELAANELKETPRQGLLIKCLANSGGDEKKGNALYIKTRVSELKSESSKRKFRLSLSVSKIWAKECFPKFFPNKKALTHVIFVSLVFSIISNLVFSDLFPTGPVKSLNDGTLFHPFTFDFDSSGKLTDKVQSYESQLLNTADFFIYRIAVILGMTLFFVIPTVTVSFFFCFLSQGLIVRESIYTIFYFFLMIFTLGLFRIAFFTD